MPAATLDHATLLARLAADAEYLRPQLFAVYGVSNAVANPLPEKPFLGWGIDFGEEWGAIFWNPIERVTHISDSAEQVLKTYQRAADAHLVWLE